MRKFSIVILRERSDRRIFSRVRRSFAVAQDDRPLSLRMTGRRRSG
jgi:hypothetical protein